MRRGGSDLAGTPEAPAVLATKLFMPHAPPRAVARPRLSRLLDSAEDKPLTTVCAPAGWGKTTALAEWLSQAGTASAWLSLDAGDNDPPRLIAHMLAAFRRALPAATDDIERALGGGDPNDHDTVVALTLQALADHAAGGLVVVLDDFHLVEHPSCHKLLSAAVDTAPPRVRVVVATRMAPRLHLGRRRAAEAVAEIGPAELRFHRSEVELLLNESLALALEPGEIDAIHRHLDGWPAGLALVGTSLARHRDRAALIRGLEQPHGGVAGRSVADYLVEEVLDGTESRLREFLYRTSILGRLNAALCEVVADDPRAGELLAEVRRSNLFVTALDPGGAWLRYHHVFGAVLQRELRERSPRLVSELHRRAAAWFHDAGMAEDAIHHASAAGDGEWAAEMLRQSWRALQGERRRVTLRRMLERLPRERGELSAFCEALEAACIWLEGADPMLVRERIEALESRRDAPGVAPIIDQLRINPFFGNVAKAVAAGRAAWKGYAGSPQLRLELAGQLGLVLWFAGDGDTARTLLEPRVAAIPQPGARSWALSTLALIHAGDGNGDDGKHAERYAREAVAIAEAGCGEVAHAVSLAHVALGAALRRRGALDEALRSLAQAERMTARLPGSVQHALTLVCQASVHLARRERACAAAKAAATRAIIDRFDDVGVLTRLLAQVESTVQRRDDTLLGSAPTPAELRVLALLPRELSIAGIAAQLYVSTNTVKSHVRRLYRRLGASSRDGAVAAARQQGLL